MTEEYEDNEQNEDDHTTAVSSSLPEGVLERLEQYATRTKQDIQKVVADFLEQINKEHGCTDPSQEDEDLLIDWAEQMFIETRNIGGGGAPMAGSVPFVGCFVGVDDKRRDRRSNLVARAKRDFTLDPNNAIGSGMVGHYIKQNGQTQWSLSTNNGTALTEIPVDEVPENSFIADGERICLLAKSGRPKAMSMNGRNYHFLGAPESDFTNDGAIQLWRLDMQGEDADAEVLIGEPCRIMHDHQARRPLKDSRMSCLPAWEYPKPSNTQMSSSMRTCVVYSDHSSFGQTTNYTLTSSHSMSWLKRLSQAVAPSPSTVSKVAVALSSSRREQ